MLLFLEEVVLRLRFVPRPKLTGAAAQARRRDQNRQRQAKRRALKRGKGKAMEAVEASLAVEGEEVEEVEKFEEFSDGEELVETVSRPLNSNSGIESSFCSLLTRLTASRRPFIPALAPDSVESGYVSASAPSSMTSISKRIWWCPIPEGRPPKP